MVVAQLNYCYRFFREFWSLLLDLDTISWFLVFCQTLTDLSSYFSPPDLHTGQAVGREKATDV